MNYYYFRVLKANFGLYFSKEIIRHFRFRTIKLKKNLCFDYNLLTVLLQSETNAPQIPKANRFVALVKHN